MISMGVDIGGTGCKCAAFSCQGEQLAISYREYPLKAWQSHLPPETLKAAVFAVIADCAGQLENPAEVETITVSSFGESFVALDQNGRALDDVLLYFGKQKNAAFDAVVKTVGPKAFMEICRILPNTAYSLANMMRIADQFHRRVWKYLFIAGFICYYLSGEVATDISLACRTLLYDVKRNCWSRRLLEAAGISQEQLPAVVPAGTVLGPILPDMAADLGLPEGTAIVLGAHDQIVNALGAGVAQCGDAVDTTGTSECITPLFAEMPPGLDFQRNNFACVPYLSSGGYVTYAYNISAGSVVRWCRDALAGHWGGGGGKAYERLNEQAPGEPTSLMVLPFLQGMGGTPEVNDKATGLIAGLTTQTRLPDIYRAILEGVSFEMRYNQEKLADSGIHFQRLVACGGGARSPVWLQIKADILGCEIIPSRVKETGAMGSAVLGIAAVTGENCFTAAKRFLRYGDPVLPVPAHVELYQKRYQLYKKLRTFYKEI